jgi:hypothetical protein
MEVFKNVSADLKDGKVFVEINVGAMLLPRIEALELQVQNGEIDLIKGTDFDKVALLQVIAIIKAELVK